MVKKTAPVNEPEQKADEVSEEEALAAREEIKAALALISNKLGKGKSKVAKGLKEVEHLSIIKPQQQDG